MSRQPKSGHVDSHSGAPRRRWLDLVGLCTYSLSEVTLVTIYYFENVRENGPFGAAGVGELPLTSPHVAVI